MTLHRWRVPVSVWLFLFIAAAPAAGQQTGTLIGDVRDAQGAVLPGVTITATSDALIGGPRSVVSTETGAYQIAPLPPGTYTVTYELIGFAPLRREGIIVQVGATFRF
jgi:Carboxypeptidase regulatory-like domain